MTIMQVGVVSCLGVNDTPGRCAVKPRKESSERVLSRRGRIRGKGMVISSMSNHRENDGNRPGSTRQRRGHWFHLNQSYEQKVMRG